MSAIAKVIVNISIDAIDRAFDYIIPDRLISDVCEGTPVQIPFGKGNSIRSGYVVEITDHSVYDYDKLKEIISITTGEVSIEGKLLELAAWIKNHYGGTMNEAIKTVLPVHTKIKAVTKKWIRLIISPDRALDIADKEQDKNHVAKARLLRGLTQDNPLEFSAAKDRYKTTKAVLDSLINSGYIEVTDTHVARTPDDLISKDDEYKHIHTLNAEQQAAFDVFKADIDRDIYKTYLLYGVTGSGKTEVYMSMLREVISRGGQAIVLIPEIALTHQTVVRFRTLFNDRVTVIHSRMSQGERFDQFQRAKNGEVDIVVGPRSALFAPFERLKLIVIDEEHEGSYQSEKSPSYHAREVAIHRARLCEASVVLGSATPSVESYKAAMDDKYKLLTLTNRAADAKPPTVHVVDLRDELKAKNYSIFSRLLTEKIHDRLSKHEQTMLFINRRGYAGFVSCRSCGHVIKCPHCDVSMTEHNRRSESPKLICHYCGYETPMLKVCPECSSPYIASFGLGTEKVFDMVSETFPDAKVLRMDADTTKNKGGHERVMAPFREGEADILIGTQMIVKGHDVKNVTLVGAIAADLSMHISDYTSYENTFDLLMQAGGRAGRGDKIGEFIIQTYDPDAYCIEAVRRNEADYFYEEELSYRRIGGYPPYKSLLRVLISSPSKTKADTLAKRISDEVDRMGLMITRLGPTPDTISYIKDRYRVCIHFKSDTTEDVDRMIKAIDEMDYDRDCYVSFLRSAV